MGNHSEQEKEATYREVLTVIQGLFEAERDRIACMANVAAVLMEAFGHHWVGFYRVMGDQLVLGPFQGPLACMRIGYGKGVCGSAWAENRTLIVPDVDKFRGHIACSSLSRSEIVVPVRCDDGQVMAVLDIDSARLDAFSETDRHYLEKICALF
jgi:GAF domain protein